jgi:hypothetical protein
MAGRIGDDLLIGQSQVAAELGVTPRAALHLLERGLIPSGRLGGRYVVSKRRLRKHFEAIAAGETAR